MTYTFGPVPAVPPLSRSRALPSIPSDPALRPMRSRLTHGLSARPDEPFSDMRGGARGFELTGLPHRVGGEFPVLKNLPRPRKLGAN
ncbi:hypothetical protein [Rhodovulum sp. ES.010]|uniref:hypothetical protein n=1 Tax=Rhodovulum sp. ES.010 TaxID=1882821 RepID=UPI001588292B|nr:hypothetical protein [Rhodovulum sp. ES.010]